MMRGSVLPLSAVLLALLAAARGQGVCSDATDLTAVYDDGPVNMNCGVQTTYRWWRSNDGCRSFVEHTICNTAPSCFPTVDASLERYYHFCCTDESVADGSEVATSSPTCFHIQICTEISNMITPPIVLLGATEKLYILLFGEPPPTDSPELKLVNATNALVIKRLSAPQIDSFYLNESTSEQTFIYTFDVPNDDILSVSDIRLEFSTQYSNPVNSCLGERETTIDISVSRTRITATPSPTPAPTSTACPPAMPCRSVTNLALGFIASSVILLILLLLLAMALVLVCWKLLHQRQSSDISRPPNLPIGRQYHPLRQTSVTPGTPGNIFANSGQQPPLPPPPHQTPIAETAFTAIAETVETTTAEPPLYETPETLGSQDSTSTGTGDTDEEADAGMSDSQSTDTERMSPSAVDYTDSSHIATDSETVALEAELTVTSNHGAVYDGLNRELPNSGPSRDV